jgi:hypothetical protein
MQDVQECIKSISHPAKTLENFHWATGSDLRSIWAQEKISQTAQQASIDSSTLRDLLYSYSWCGISKDLGGQAIDIGGLPADESSLSSLAIEKLSEAQQAVSSSSHPDFDASWHLQNGIDANKSGLFGAAIYEATYAISMQEATDDQNGNITAAIEKLSSPPRQSLWGKIYFGQGMYLKKQSEEEGFPPTDAYRILKYSYELDRVSSQIDRELAAASSRPPAPIGPVNAKTSTQTDFYLFIFLALCVAALGFAALYRVAKINLTRERIFIK